MKILCIIRVNTDRQETDSQKKEMKECCMFYEDKPLYIIDGSIRSVNKEVDDLIYNKIELPILNYEELGKATADLIYKGLE